MNTLLPPNTQKRTLPGQSLVEFVLVLPILLLVLIGGFTFAMGTYQAHMASDAVQFAMLRANDMANEPGAVGGGTVQGYMNSGGLKGSAASGSLVDGVTLNDAGFLVASKNFVSSVSFIPGFTIKVGQAINPSLLKPISSGGAQSRPAGTPWVPGGTMTPPPWTAGGAATVATTTDATTATATATDTTTTTATATDATTIAAP